MNKEFGETAIRYSEDPFVKNNHGDLGFITVFDLPYSIETIRLQYSIGKIQPGIQNGRRICDREENSGKKSQRAGFELLRSCWHFLTRQVMQAKAQTRQRADSIYQAILTWC